MAGIRSFMASVYFYTTHAIARKRLLSTAADATFKLSFVSGSGSVKHPFEYTYLYCSCVTTMNVQVLQSPNSPLRRALTPTCNQVHNQSPGYPGTYNIKVGSFKNKGLLQVARTDAVAK